MAELQSINFKIEKENLTHLAGDTGGAIRELECLITVDTSFSEHNQKISVVHETLGAYLGCVVPFEILAEIAEQIVDNLEFLDGAKTSNGEAHKPVAKTD